MFCRAEDELSLNLTRVRIVLENSANISLSLSLPCSVCLSLSLFLPIGKVKSCTIEIRFSISGFACLCNRKRQAAGPQSADQGDADGRRKAPSWQQPCLDVIVRARMKSALTKCVDWWMDKAGNWMWEWMRAEGEFNTDKQNERQRGIAC